MSSTESEIVHVSFDGKHNLLKQKIHGENRIVDDPWAMASKERVTMTLKTSRNRNDRPSSPKILIAYTTKNEDKINCLERLFEEIVQFQYPGLQYERDEISIETLESEKKVGKQPFSPYGQRGNLCRVEEAFRGIKWRTELLGDEAMLKDYYAAFILSIESDIDDKLDGPTKAVPHDQPNMMIYECFSGQFIAGVGRGPGVQQDLLDIAKEGGFLDENDNLKPRAGKVTYGQVLANKFNVDPGNWHYSVSRYHRSHYFDELRNKIVSVAKVKIRSGELNFHLPDKPDELLG